MLLPTSPTNINKIQMRERTENKHPQLTLAPRTNLIILSPGRGGSSFLGALFDSNPQIMYWFEPLRTVSHLFSETRELISYRETCMNLINSFFKCDFTNLTNASTILYELSRDSSRRKSKALTSGYFLCPGNKAPVNCTPFTDTLLTKACNSNKHTVIKILTSRVPNKTIQSIQELFQQQAYDVKLIHLVRDPRAVIYSRINSVKWITGTYMDDDFRLIVHDLCDPIEQNVRMGLISPPPWLKDRFKVIRYEDLVVDTSNIAQELYRFAGFDWSMSVDKWITNHQRQPSNDKERTAYSLYRNVSHVIDQWKNAPEDLIRAVEDICGDLMKILGYDKWIKLDNK